MSKGVKLVIEGIEQKKFFDVLLSECSERKAAKVLGVDKSTIKKIANGKMILAHTARHILNRLDELVKRIDKKKTETTEQNKAKAMVPVEYVEIIIKNVIDQKNKEIREGMIKLFNSSVPLLTTLREAYKERILEENTLLQRFYDYVVVPLFFVSVFYLVLFRLGVITF